jgi:hypothetical protein
MGGGVAVFHIILNFCLKIKSMKFADDFLK